MAECSQNGLKTLCEKEKLFIMSNFSFPHSVFKRLVLQTRENQGLFGKWLTMLRTSEKHKFFSKPLAALPHNNHSKQWSGVKEE